MAILAMATVDSASADKTGSGRRFTLLRTLGEGSFGIVYLAEMESAGGFKRIVALKLLQATFDPESDAGLRLRDEARLLGRLNHRNIVRVDDLVRLNGRWALVMEYVSGAGLEALIDAAGESHSRLSPKAVAEAGAAVAGALASAWTTLGENGEPLAVIHRDIKPSNVHLSDTGEIKVLDFGVARAAMSGREARTEGVRYGSLGYMAPERLLGESGGPEGDIYGLGVLLWELLTLGVYGRVELMMDRQAAQVATAHATLVQNLGEAPPASLLTDLIVRSLAYNPGERPGAAEMAAGLRGAAAALPGQDLVAFAAEFIPRVPETTIHAVRRTVLEETITSPGALDSGTLDVFTLTDLRAPLVPPPEERPPEVRPPSRSRPLPWGAIGAVLLLVSIGFVGLLTAAFLFLRPGDATLEAAPSEAASDPLAAPPSSPVGTLAATAPSLPRSVSPPSGSASPDIARAEAARVEVASVDPTQVAAAPKPLAQRARPEPPPPPAPASTAPVLRAVKFSLEGAEGIEVSCGAVSRTGDTSALLRDVPPGICTVVVADRLRTTLTVNSPGGIKCTVDGESLQCR